VSVLPRRTLIAAGLLAAPALVPGSRALAQDAGTATDAGPEAVVERLHAQLVSVMREADSLGYRGRFESLRPVLPEIFDFESMARFAVGRSNWETLDAGQRATLVDRFAAMSTANYARAFDGYSGQTFVTQGASDGPRGVTIVATRLERPNGDPVPLNYVTRPTDDGWRVLDVLLDGSISELARRRSEISSIFAARGYDGVIASLEDAVEG